MIDLTRFKTKEQLHAFYLANPDAIEFKAYMDLLTKLAGKTMPTGETNEPTTSGH